MLLQICRGEAFACRYKPEQLPITSGELEGNLGIFYGLCPFEGEFFGIVHLVQARGWVSILQAYER